MAVIGGTLLDREFVVHVLEVPAGMEDIDGSTVSMALIVLRRQTGMLLALPVGVFSEETLAAGAQAESGGEIGLSHQASVSAGIKLDLADDAMPDPLLDGSMVDVLLVDVASNLADLLVPFDPQVHTMDIMHTFNANEPNLMPLPLDLAQVTWGWINEPGSGDLVAFYSAEEAELVPETPMDSPSAAPLHSGRRRPLPNGGGGGQPDAPKSQPRKAPRPTVASLAASLDQVTSTLPAMVAQMEKLSARTEAMEQQLRGDVSRPSALKTPLGVSAMNGLSAPSVRASAVAKEFPVPKSSAQIGSLPGAHKSYVAQELQQLEEERETGTESADLARAMLVQSQALSSLVQQLSGADPIQDLSTTGSTLSTKGAQGRMKLQQELAAHRGTFFQSVLQSMARRMQPARPAEQTPSELALRGVTPTAYVERFGGYGRNKDLGCLQWQVAMILDHLQNENIAAAKDSAALLAVCLEQAALDSGRLDIGLLLSLSEDPPSGVFQNRATTSYARGRAFAPLADQRWVTVALAFIKEMDLIATKRQDAIGVKPDRDTSAASSNPAPKRTPKKTKGGGKESKKRRKSSSPLRTGCQWSHPVP